MPGRYRTIRGLLRNLGIQDRQGKGSHVVLRDQRGRTFPVTLHNGEKSELPDQYIRALCRTFEIDYDDFKTKLWVVIDDRCASEALSP